ncbi:MAG: ATP-binding cassette domain-containing protein [Erysipelotrichaceae bacterium]|nr:ATP-binding cassette domain-containing protein [Erysipelotrichaceae bacterium]
MLEVRDVRKSFGNREVLKGISFSLYPGEITSLIGGNGSGKTTTFRLILGYLDPDDGRISLNGRPVDSRDVCYLAEQRSLYQDCRVQEQLRYTARLAGIADSRRRIDDWLDELKLIPLKDEKISRLSKGNQQKVALINCLIKDAPVVIMDEPFTALDRDNIDVFMKIISRLPQQGKTVLISSHIYQPVNAVCDHFLILKEGKIKADLTRNQLKEDDRRMVIVPSEYEASEDAGEDGQIEENETTRYVFSDSWKASGFALQAISNDEDVIYRHRRIEDCQ